MNFKKTTAIAIALFLVFISLFFCSQTTNYHNSNNTNTKNDKTNKSSVVKNKGKRKNSNNKGSSKNNHQSEKIKSYLFSKKKSNQTGSLITNVSKEDLDKRLSLLSSKDLVYEYNTTNHGYIEKYLRMGNYFGRIIGLSEYYFPLFDEVFEKYNIPKQLKYLAVVESKLTVNVTSHAGAKGLWQFMPGTAKLFKLENNAFIDERLDPIKSTEAAAKYFILLYKYFGSWEMVMAAYNCGEGNVRKAIARSGGKKNYWEIRNFLPLETRGYIPSFIAASYMMNYHESHRVKIEKFKYTYKETDTLQVNNQIILSKVSKKIGMSLEEIIFLNPQYKNGIIPKVPGKKYYLRLPKEKHPIFKSSQSDIYRDNLLSKQMEKKQYNMVDMINSKIDSMNR